MKLTEFDFKMDDFESMQLKVCSDYCQYNASMLSDPLSYSEDLFENYCCRCPMQSLNKLYMSALRADALLDK